MPRNTFTFSLTMNSIRLIFCIMLCIAIASKAQGADASAEDLKDEYYKTIMKPNEKYIPQDEKDAQAIIDSDRKEDVIASILSYRDKIRRFFINERVLTKIDPIGSTTSGHQTRTRHYWVSQWYQPQRTRNSTCTFLDLCFGLLEDENVVLGQYLDNFFDALDETGVVIGMVLAKDMDGLITTYNRDHAVDSFKDQRNAQKEPFKNMLRVWVEQNRDPIEATEPDSKAVKDDANKLKAEYESGDWHEKCRDHLELILMKKSIKYSRAVLAEFQTIMGNKTLDTIINENVECGCKINYDLADAYSSLARYITDKHSYIADLLGKYCDGSDRWAAWIMCIAVVHPDEWSKIDTAFQAKNKKQTLKDFILQKLTSDKIMAEMIAIIVDSTYKPKTFSSIPGPGGPPLTPGPPPVPPTVPAPAPAPPATP